MNKFSVLSVYLSKLRALAELFVFFIFAIFVVDAKAEDMVSTREVRVESESSGISVNPVNMLASGLMSAAGVAVGGGSVFAGATSASSSSMSSNTRQVRHEASTVRADRFILRAGNAHLTDTQIRARLVDAIVRDDLILESLCDEFFSESDGGSFGMGFGFLNLVKGIQTVRDTLMRSEGRRRRL